MRVMLVAAAMLFAVASASGATSLDEAIGAIVPEIRKWAAICIVSRDSAGKPAFSWHEYQHTGDRTDFWPASAIKVYAAVAALELLNERGFSLDTALIFEHRESDSGWILDCARSMREMLSEVFRRSSNEDYTLLLRFVGIDRINTQFLVAEKGFPHSALMRGYVLGRPYGYTREEPQRITLRSPDGRTEMIEHVWSGRFYAEERGASVIDARTGNVTSPRELAECLRRILFHDDLPAQEQYHLTADQLQFLRHGGAGLSGLENRIASSEAIAWKNAIDAVFPQARFYHKAGVISSYALELAAIDDRAASGREFILVPVVAAGSETKPESGQRIISRMSQAIAEWIRDMPRPRAGADVSPE
jgi:hypothetical protein